MRNSKFITTVIAAMWWIAMYGQEKAGIISGMVKDAHTKTPITEAVVTLKADSFKGEKYALTDSTGMYRVNNLPAGTYTITFEMEGYEKFTKDGIVVSPNTSLGVSFEMIKERRAMKRATASNKED